MSLNKSKVINNSSKLKTVDDLSKSKAIINLSKLTKILDTNKYLQNLLKNKTFIIKNGTIHLECEIKITKSIIKNFQYYKIRHIDCGFMLSFAENRYPSITSVYIDSFNKTLKYTGSEIIKTILKFLTTFNSIQKINLHDGSTINCPNNFNFNYSLTLFSLITTKKTFYGKYGFELDPSNIITEKEINKIIDNCSNTKVENIIKESKKILKFINIFKNVVKPKKNNNNDGNDDYNDFDDYHNYQSGLTMYAHIIAFIKILEDNLKKNETFKNLLIRLRNNNKCNQISIILQICEKLSYKLISLSKNKTGFLYNFSQLNEIRNNISARVYYTNNKIKNNTNIAIKN